MVIMKHSYNTMAIIGCKVYLSYLDIGWIVATAKAISDYITCTSIQT